MTNIIISVVLSLSMLGFTKSKVKQKPIQHKSAKAVFPDVKVATYKITYDLKKETAKVHTKIVFEQSQDGYTFFDLVPETDFMEIDGKKAQLEDKRIEGVTKFKVTNKQIKAGEHTLEIKNSFDKLIDFGTQGVKSAFWMSDLSDRRYLEQFIPSSFEYDQVKMYFEVQILNANKEHRLFTNGKITKLAKNHFKVKYPSFYTTSSIFYHLVPEGSYKIREFDYKSIDGRTIPITVYKKSTSSNSLLKFKTATLKYMAQLEKDFGPWPHDFFIAYGVSPFQGGMEYAGATWTSFRALRHEMDHSYFARNIMPGRGNSGWIDEAIASWGDDDYPQYSTPKATGVASHSPYRRTTDRNAYGPGSVLLGVLDKKFDSKGGLKPFLKDYFERNKETVISTPFFQKEMEDYFNTNLAEFFDKYIYRKRSTRGGFGLSQKSKTRHPFHKKHSYKDLKAFL